jgi:hypothetical protein
VFDHRDDDVTVLRNRLHYIFDQRIQEATHDTDTKLPSIEFVQKSILYAQLNQLCTGRDEVNFGSRFKDKFESENWMY